MNIAAFNRIVFYGCSFTVGAELSDHELFPNLTREQVEKRKKKAGYNFYNGLDRELLRKLDNQKSWARWFADNVGLPWENRAKPGSSMGQIIFELENDIAFNFIQDSDLIIVGITSPERILSFDEFGCKTVILNFQNSWSNKHFELEFRKNIANDDYILYNWVKDVRYLDLLSKKFNGRIQQQWMWGTYHEVTNFSSLTGVPYYDITTYVKNLIDTHANIKSVINNNISFSTINAWDPENRYTFFHPKIEIHKKFADLVFQDFKNKFKL